MQPIVRCIAFLALGLTQASCAGPNPAHDQLTTRPNVLWICAEDLSPHLGSLGAPVDTPALDAMAERGALFTNMIMPAPVCSPCRSALITGAMQTTLGLHNHHSSRTLDSAIHLPESVKTLPELFRDAGYFTFNSGKDDYNFWYDRRDLYAGEHEEHPLYGKRGKPIDWRARPDPNQPFFGQIQLAGGKHVFKNDARFRALVDAPVDRAAVELPPYYPRSPEMVEAWARYLEAMQITDREVAGILARLEEDGVLGNTLVFFFADHGMRFLRHKQFLYEGGIRAPLIACWGKDVRVSSESRREELVSGLDISATSLAVAGIELPDHVEGVDLFDPTHEPREYVISARDRCDFTIDRIRSVRTKRFKYIRNFMLDRPALQPNYRDEWELTKSLRRMYHEGALSPEQAAHFREERVPEELYDLDRDPHELVNLAARADYADALERHRAILEDWIERTDDQGQYPEQEAGLRFMLGIWGEQAVNPEYDPLRTKEPGLAGSLRGSKKEQPFRAVSPTLPQVQALDLPAQVSLPEAVDLAGSFTVRLLVRCVGAPPDDLPMLVANKAWESGAVRDYTTNNSYGFGRESGSLAGFAISVLPDGAWTWNAGDGESRIDHRPEAADQTIVDGSWHEVGFALDRELGVAHLFHDGRRVALHDLQGVGSLESETSVVRLGNAQGFELADVRIEPGVVSAREVAEAFTQRFGEARRPPFARVWDGRPLRVLAWNIWHGGRRKGVDEGVQRVVEVIEDSGADIVLMQETYGSGPRISGRLGFDYFLRSSNLSILSRFPIRDVHRLHEGFRFGGATIELRPGTEIEAYSLWINHLPSVGTALEEGATPEQLVEADAKTRGAEIDAILRELVAHREASPPIPVLVGGDFNSGSHLDWTEEAAELANHCGRVVPWPVSRSMEREGFIDTFRAMHPDPVADAGHTWSPEFRESHPDRIDYVYASGGDWRVVDSKVLAEHPRGWPSDHAAVLSTLELVAPEPVPEDSLRVLSYNTYYVFSEGTQVDAATDWIARQAPDVVALQELTNIEDERLSQLAAGWGHEHSRLLKTEGFSVGLTSNSPIEVVERIRDGLHHGCLHARVNGIHVFVVHLSPFRWETRASEAELLLAKIQPLLEQDEEVLVLGDFNALSPADRGLLEAQPSLLQETRASDAEHDHVSNLREGAFDYSVMQRFFDAGLEDAALPFLDESGATRWTIPTGIWSEEKTDPPEGGSRVDFVLADPTLAAKAISARVVRTGVVNRTSDHYPVLVEFRR